MKGDEEIFQIFFHSTKSLRELYFISYTLNEKLFFFFFLNGNRTYDSNAIFKSRKFILKKANCLFICKILSFSELFCKVIDVNILKGKFPRLKATQTRKKVHFKMFFFFLIAFSFKNYYISYKFKKSQQKKKTDSFEKFIFHFI